MSGAPYGRWLPWNAADEAGAKVDQLIALVHWLMLILFVVWGIYFVYCLVKFRARPGHKATYQLPHGKASKYGEIAVALIELVLLVFVSMPAWWKYKYEPPVSENRLEVRCVGEQFKWTFHYPGPDGKFGDSDASNIDPQVNVLGLVGRDDSSSAAYDDVVESELHVVVDQPVFVRVTSKDVIHSFDIPLMRVKQDAIPGMEVPVWFHPKMTSAEIEPKLKRIFKLDSNNPVIKTRVADFKTTQEYKNSKGEVLVASGEQLDQSVVEKLLAGGVTEIEVVPRFAMEVVCAQLCGISHYTMKASMVVHDQAGYDAWMAAKTAVEDFDDFD